MSSVLHLHYNPLHCRQWIHTTFFHCHARLNLGWLDTNTSHSQISETLRSTTVSPQIYGTSVGSEAPCLARYYSGKHDYAITEDIAEQGNILEYSSFLPGIPVLNLSQKWALFQLMTNKMYPRGRLAVSSCSLPPQEELEYLTLSLFNHFPLPSPVWAGQ